MKTVTLKIVIFFAVASGAIIITAIHGVTSNISDRQFFNGTLPGVDQFDEKLLNKFEQMKENRGKHYHPRTKHLRSDGWAKYTNRLFLESSPYLIQHAHNPVNWYPWGDEAFETAKKLNRPVLLSVGYSTCHWCHVMEEESFEDGEIARYMNENYIAIKVDREERPDLDAIYMRAVQAMTGRGGWPMNVWLTPDRKPFYGGTYFPARDGDRGIGMGFLTLLKELDVIYRTKQDRVEKSSRQLALIIQKMLRPKTGDHLPGSKHMHQAAAYYKRSFDPVLREFRKQFLPNRTLIVAGAGKELDAHAKIVPVARGKLAIGGKATAYVCEKGYCSLPAKDPMLFAKQIKEVTKLKADTKK